PFKLARSILLLNSKTGLLLLILVYYLNVSQLFYVKLFYHSFLILHVVFTIFFNICNKVCLYAQTCVLKILVCAENLKLNL
uniref:Uncharacterized protein n=1 Tax=Ciona intestinalis TaxID=7719 RepID=H2XSF9_CIOIN